MNNEQVKTILQDALTLMDNGDKWIKGDYRDEQGRMCLSGAICSASKADRDYDKVAENFLDARSCVQLALQKRFTRRLVDIVGFNDSPTTKFQDIEQILKAAIAIAEKGFLNS